MSKRAGANRPALWVVGKDDADDPLFADYGPVKEPPARGSPPQQRAREGETFARIPHDRALELHKRIDGAAWIVLIELDRMVLAQHGKNPVLFWSSRLRNIKLAANARKIALQQLEAASVIKITPRGKGLAPLVTHLWYPLRD
jgi:hypothetical protein